MIQRLGIIFAVIFLFSAVSIFAEVDLVHDSEYSEHHHEYEEESSGPIQFNIGGGMDLVVVPLQVVSRDTLEYEDNVWVGAGIGRNYQASGIRTRLNISGSYDELFGFRTDLWFLYTNDGTNLWSDANYDTMEIRLGDYGFLWWQPLDWFRINVGRIFNPSQTGYVHNHWLSLWSVPMLDGNNIFSYHYSGGIGILADFSIPKVEGLSIYAFIPEFGMPFYSDDYEFGWMHNGILTPGGDVLNSDDEDKNASRLFRVLQRTWITVGYETDTYHARLQFIGANPGGRVNFQEDVDGRMENTDPFLLRVSFSAPRFEAAFAYTGIENLVLDMGLKTWLPVSNWISDTWSQDVDNPGYIRLTETGTYWGGFGFGLGVSYSGLFDSSLVLNFRADGDMFRRWSGVNPNSGIETVITNPIRLSFHVWPEYTFTNGMELTLSAGLNYVGRNTVDEGGSNPNDHEDYKLNWERSHRIRFGAGLALMVPLVGHSSVNLGLAYRHGTADIHGGEAQVFSVPIMFYYHW
ncbi:MAG: hypothetical protein FWG89_05325 [Treponema sp.]|nr:hypothetical protein [Treponema sp.]